MRDQEAVVALIVRRRCRAERLASAERFIGWIADEIAPTSAPAFSRSAPASAVCHWRWLERRPDVALTVLEPAANLFDELQERLGDRAGITARKATSTELLDDDPAPVVRHGLYVNVLEHIRDDDAELRTRNAVLVDPAARSACSCRRCPPLYGSLDYKSGHYRRYSPRQLAAWSTAPASWSCRCATSIRSASCRTGDVQAARRGSLARCRRRGYDRVLVPVGRALQRLVTRPPFGKNLVAIGRRVAVQASGGATRQVPGLPGVRRGCRPG